MTSKTLHTFVLTTAWLLAGLLACPNSATAQTTMYWDPGTTSSTNGGGTQTWNSSLAYWYNGTMDTTWGPGNIASFGGSAGTVTLGAAETADGLTFTTSGYTISGSPTLTLGGSTPTITVPSGGTETITCILGGSNGMTESGSGTLVLGGVNTYSGGTTIPAGSTLKINVPAGAGTGTITDNGILFVNLTSSGTVANGITGSSTSVVEVNLNSGANSYINGSLSGFYGTITITNTSGGSDLCGMTSAGALSLPSTAGGIVIGSNTELYISLGGGVEAAPVTINGPGYGAGYGAIRLDSGTVAGNILLNGNTTNNQLGGAGTGPATYSGVISDGGNNYGLNIYGAGSTPYNKIFTLSGENTYGGPTTLTSGTAQVAATENQGTSGPLGRSNTLSTIYFSGVSSGGNAGGGRLQYSSANQYDYSGRFSSGANQSYRIDVNGQSVAFAYPMASSGGTFILWDTAGGGTLTLNAANSYTGATTISNGTLVANAAGAVPGAITLYGGALIANATGAVGGAVALNNNAALTAAASGSVNGNITLSSVSNLLTLGNASALPTNATLTLPASPAAGEVTLNFSGTQTISGLYLGGSSRAGGTYGALGSTAANKSAVFAGNSLLNVVPPVYPGSYWDPGATNASPGSGGSGTWNSNLSNWWTSGSSDTAWTSSHIANFAGAAGTVTLGASESALGLSFITSGYTLMNSNSSVLTLSAPETVSVGSGSATVACPIAGAAGVNQNGAGTLVLSASNTYSGPTVISGTLTIGGAGDLGDNGSGTGSYAGSIADYGSFIYNSSAPQTLAGVISDSGFGGTVVQAGPGLLILSGANAYIGNTTVNPGCALQLNTVAAAGTGTIALATNSVLVISNRVNNAGVPNPITGDPSTVVWSAAGSGDNTYFSGSLSNFYGTIICSNTSVTGFTGVNTAPPLGMPTNAGGWVVSDNATLYFGIGSSTEVAPITLNGPGVSYGAIRLDSGTVAGNVLLNANNCQIGGALAGNVTFSGVISDGGNNYGLTIYGAGSTPSNKVFVISGQNTYGGPTTLIGGECQVASVENQGISGPLGMSNAASTIIFNGTSSGGGAGGGVLQYSSVNHYDYSGRFDSSGTDQYRIDVNGQSVTFASPLASSGGTFLLFDTVGGGKLTMSATNTYSGLTTISGGTLDISVTGFIAGDVTNAAGTLELDNNAALSLGATLGVNVGATVNLTYAGTAYIGNLFVAGIQQPPGVYGSANNPSGVFTGSGTLTVGILPPVTFSSAAVQNNQLVISWSSVPGGSYNVYSTTNLTFPFPSGWTSVAVSIPATGTKTTYTLPGTISDYAQLFLAIQQ